MTRILRIAFVVIGLLVAGHAAAAGGHRYDSYAKVTGFKVEVADPSNSGRLAADAQWKAARGVYRPKGAAIEHRMTLIGPLGGCSAGSTSGASGGASASASAGGGAGGAQSEHDKHVFVNNFAVEVDGWSTNSNSGVTKLTIEPVDYSAGPNGPSGTAVATIVLYRVEGQPTDTDQWGRNPVSKNVKVTVKNQRGNLVRTFTLQACRPLEWSSMDLGSQGGAQTVHDTIKVSCASLTTASPCTAPGDRGRSLLLAAVGTGQSVGPITLTAFMTGATAQQSLRLAAPTLVRYTPPSLDGESESEADETMEFVDIVVVAAAKSRAQAAPKIDAAKTFLAK